MQDDADAPQPESFARADTHRAGLAVVLGKLLEKLLGVGPHCAVHLQRERAKSNPRSQIGNPPRPICAEMITAEI
jgi:hypothetical protein